MKTIDRYIILIILLIIFSPWYLPAQTWPVTYGEPDEYDVNFDVAEAYDKGYYVLGNITETLVYSKSWLIKTDVNGEVLWEKIFTNTGYNLCTAMEPTMDGGVLLCGFIRDDMGSTSIPSVVKIDACGEKVWCTTFDENLGGAASKWAQDIKESPEGDIIVLVNMYDENPTKTMHLFKLNADGEVLWRNVFCSGYEHPESTLALGEDVIITSENKYLINGSAYWEDPWNPGGVKVIRPVFIMVSSTGKEEWVLPFGMNDSIYGDALAQSIEIENNRFISAGQYRPDSPYYDEGVIMEFDHNGNELNLNRVRASEIDASQNRLYFYDMKISHSLAIFGGSIGLDYVGTPAMEATSDTNLFNSNLDYHSYIQHFNFNEKYSLELSSNEKILSSISLDTNSDNWDISLSKLNLNLEFDTLDPGTYTYDSLCTTPGLPRTGFISLDDCNIWVSMDEISTPDQYYESIRWIPITAHPNPVKDGKLTLEFQNTKHHQNMELRCYDNFGRQIHSQKIYKAQQDTELDVTGWSKGVYVAVIYSNGGARGKVKFVVE